MSKLASHPFNPIYNSDSKLLILGSFPSVKSREGEFYYHHPRNRFWKLISQLYNSAEPITIEDKINILLNNNIALWDVVKSCEVVGSADSSIKNIIPNDIASILKGSKIERIVANGNLTYDVYMKYVFPITGMPIIKMPSTSPANAKYTVEKLSLKWKEIII